MHACKYASDTLIALPIPSVQTYAADEAQRPLVLEVLDAAVQLHLTVVRAWAFNDGAEQWQALQTEPGEFA